MRILTTALLLFVVVGLSGSGCASAENEAMSGIGIGSPDASVDGRATGSCSPRYCPTPTNASGVGCCLTPNGPCGFDYGMGCVPSPTRDGG